MSVAVLSSIKGARSSEAVNRLFDLIKNAHPNKGTLPKNSPINALPVSALRADIVRESSEVEKQIIRENFPKEKQGYLVVSKVIED
jgi:Asp-tRNA(Asn)/Glu-tRNA(Gln) amidotransferase C subunit